MKYSFTGLFLGLIGRKWIKSLQWIVFVLLIVFLSLGALFYSYISGFRDAYIDRLQGIYPQTYIKSHGRSIEPISPQFEHSQEIFKFSQSLKFRYAPEKSLRSKLDIGIKGMERNRLQEVLRDLKTDMPGKEEIAPNTVWVSWGLFEDIAVSASFDGKGVYLNQGPGEEKYVKLKPFPLPGNKPWVLMPLEIAHNQGLSPNITSIYPQQPLSADAIQNKYEANGLQVVKWTERLPFFNYVFYKVSNGFYFVFVSGFLGLILILAFTVLKDNLQELSRFISFASFYGVKQYKVQLHFQLFNLIYVTSIVLVSWLLYHMLDNFLKNNMQILSTLKSFDCFVYLLPGLVLISLVSTAALVFYSFTRRALK